MKRWAVTLRGGEYDGWEAWAVELLPVLVAWVCGPLCQGHVSVPADPRVVLRSALSYRLTECDVEARTAVYELGDLEPGERDEAEARELVGTGAGARPETA